MQQLDKDGDARVSAEEVKAAPGLAAGAKHIDTDKDGALTGSELETRFSLYRDLRVGLRSQSFRVTYKGFPLVGAELQFVPETFLEGVIEPARGATDDQGVVAPQSEVEDLPAMRTGYYRVKVSSPNRKLPPKFGDGSALGAEVSPVSDDTSSSSVIPLQLVD
jgi:hypothetical protein